jgi:uncharacterized protein (DUF433 family)
MSVHTDQLWKSRLSLPAYQVGEAAAYARVSPSTVSAWHKRATSDQSVVGGKSKGVGLSFHQLIELAVVAEMRREGIKLAEIARAREYFEDTTGLAHPFAQLRFKTDGADILHDFVGTDGKTVDDTLIAANHSGQHVWRDMLAKRLRQFNYDQSGSVIQWKVAGEDKPILIDPRLAFGSPQVDGVKTNLIKLRFSAGEEIDEIADDFSLDESSVFEALIFEGIDRGETRLSKWIN